MQRLLIICGILLLSVTLYAQATVSGSIKSAGDEAPIPYANLLILNTDRGAAADAAGNFTLPIPSPGTSGPAPFAVRVSAIGFRADTFLLTPGTTVNLLLEKEANLPTITVSGGIYQPLKELKFRKYLPVYLAAWGDRVVTCYKRSGRKAYQLRLLDAAGNETRYDLDFGKVDGITSHCSERLYVFSEGYAISFEIKAGDLVPVERIPLNDYKWLFADCQDRKGKEYLFEKQQMRGLKKLYLLLAASVDQRIIRVYLDTSRVEEMYAFAGRLAYEASLEKLSTGGHYLEENKRIRRGTARSDFDREIRYRNHNNNAFFFAGKQIKLVNFDEGLLETFTYAGDRIAVVPFREEVDEKVNLKQRIYKDAISGRTLALARDAKGHRVYDFDADTGASRLLFRIDVEFVRELVILDDRFYILARKDRFGPESHWRIYEGLLE